MFCNVCYLLFYAPHEVHDLPDRPCKEMIECLTHNGALNFETGSSSLTRFPKAPILLSLSQIASQTSSASAAGMIPMKNDNVHAFCPSEKLVPSSLICFRPTGSVRGK